MSYHILIVDDDQSILASLSLMLRFKDYRVSTANDGAQVLRHLVTDPPDLIVLDMMMPGMSGREVVDQLRAQHVWNIPIILTTASGQASQMASELGVAAGIDKPCDSKLILQTVARLLSPVT